MVTKRRDPHAERLGADPSLESGDDAVIDEAVEAGVRRGPADAGAFGQHGNREAPVGPQQVDDRPVDVVELPSRRDVHMFNHRSIIRSSGSGRPERMKRTDSVTIGYMPVMGFETDAVYAQRRSDIALAARGPDAEPLDVDYLKIEDDTWRYAHGELLSRWRQFAAPEIMAASEHLGLPTERVPQLREVTDRLARRTGFRFRAVPGLVPVDEFFGALADGIFLSTQYVRHPSSPLYTPEPDVLHEVLGHATCLADPHLAMLHRAAGAAMTRVELAESRQFLADVFWFTAEFGVLTSPTGPLAYGAGLLSSAGELDWFRSQAVFRPIDIAAMGTLPYDIDSYQPVLFTAASLAEVTDVVGEFFAAADDDGIEALRSGA